MADDNGQARGDKQQFNSKFDKAVYHLNQSMRHLAAFQDVLSMINFDVQKAQEFMEGYRNALVNTMQANGGEVSPGTVEMEIAEFLPKALRRAKDEQKDAG
ncbi:MAG TPA: hypothetical protein VGF90_07750 [Verrucomicrobiae bacterium]